MKNNRQENFRPGFTSLLKAVVSAVCLLLISVAGVNAQTQTVTGKVTDASGQPIVGASITVVGTYTGASTGVDGEFTINADKGQQLQISYVGMKTLTLPVGGVPR